LLWGLSSLGGPGEGRHSPLDPLRAGERDEAPVPEAAGGQRGRGRAPGDEHVRGAPGRVLPDLRGGGAGPGGWRGRRLRPRRGGAVEPGVGDRGGPWRGPLADRPARSPLLRPGGRSLHLRGLRPDGQRALRRRGVGPPRPFARGAWSAVIALTREAAVDA